MAISISQQINAPMQRVWEVITDIDNANKNISGIEKVEVLERPADGVVGLKWKETRRMFGKEAIETMWISAADAPNYYETTAHNSGAIYNSRLELKEMDGGTQLTMIFKCTPTTFGSRIMSMMMFLFNGAMKKMIAKDLQDIAAASVAR